MSHVTHFLPVTILLVINLVSGCNPTANETPMENTDTLTVPKPLDIQPSATSSPNDFDFLEGKWKVHNRKLAARLQDSTEWIEFESELHMRKTLMGNVENYYAEFNGKPFEGMAVRLFNPETRLWKVYWMDSNFATMDTNPVTGSFENGVGKLYASDTFNNKPILVLYQWDATDLQHPKWSQAISEDDGKTWEWNWEMVLTKDSTQ